LAIEAVVQSFAPFQAAGLPTAFSVPAPSAAGLLPAVLLAIWFCGCVAVLLCWWVRWRRVAAAVRSSTPLTEGREVEALWRLRWGRRSFSVVCQQGSSKALTGHKKRWPVPLWDLLAPQSITLVSSAARLEPGVFGIFRPVLWLPVGIGDRLDNAELEAILAHELCHVRRRDNLAAVIHMAVEAVFWFHPLVWWLGARLTEERERACDEEVVRMGGEPQVYAESILKVCEFYLASPVACAAGVTGADLRRRIEGIMRNRHIRKLSYGKQILLAAAAVTAVGAPIAIGLLYAPSLLTGQEKPAAGASKASSFAQPAKRDFRFEVASIRPGDPSGRLIGPPVPSSPRRFSAQSETIVSLAMRAFGVKQMSQIEWQPWMTSAHFTVEATIPEGATHADLPIMIQHLLEDRFGLVFHRATRRMAGYELVAAKSGPKLAKSAAPPSDKPAGKGGDIEMKNGVPQFTKDAGSGTLLTLTTGIWRGRNETMKRLAERLADSLDAPVVDATGIEGEYDYTLTFTPEAKPVSGNMVVMSPPGAAPAQAPRQDEFLTNPLLRDALQIQLGLKLEPVKEVPVEVVVLDKARKEPTEN
jgi:uncharacterized protein (TIGR03435 family)